VGICIGLVTEYYTGGPPIRSDRRRRAKRVRPRTSSPVSRWGCTRRPFPVFLIAIAILVSFSMAGALRDRDRRRRDAGDGRGDDVRGRVRPDCGQRRRNLRDGGLGPETRKITDSLDAIGNTTAAIGKGFAIGSAALTALALFSAYSTSVGLQETGINLVDPMVVVGLFLGGTLPFLVAAMTMTAVGRAAAGMVEEVRRQFREIPGMMEGTAKPDSARCVDISTRAALREMILPGVLAVLAPFLVGNLPRRRGARRPAGRCPVTGVLMALFMANSGGAWDNAKKLIEGGEYGGKGSDAHKAAVVGTRWATRSRIPPDPR
jgi:K(+)-stimulated pyrophosphate-energized sodium pump